MKRAAGQMRTGGAYAINYGRGAHMRFLHTSDWHLGATLGGFSRLEEQRALLGEICRLARDRHVDVVLVAGDIYDSFTPPAAAEQLFLDTMDALSREGIACVVIAGNHDSPERLCAPRAFAGTHGVYIMGLPGETPQGEGILESAPNFLRIRPRGCECDCAIAALPYPSMGRLGCEEEDYAARVGEQFRAADAHFKPEYVNVAVSHLFARGGASGSVERPIEGVGGALCVDAGNMSRAQYVALGHLHRAQKAAGARYCGSIMQQDFGESGQLKQVLLVDIEPGGEPQVSEVPLISGRYLARWHVAGMDEARALIESGHDAQGWIELTIESPEPPAERELTELMRSRERIVYARWQGEVHEDEQETIDWTSRPRQELFEAFYRQIKGKEPPRDVTALFLELMSEEGGGEDETAATDV